MRYFVCCVRDLKSEAYMQPLLFAAPGEAVRGFTDQVNIVGTDERPNPFNRYPADFALFHVGFYDNATARFENLEMPALLVEAVSVKV